MSELEPQHGGGETPLEEPLHYLEEGNLLERLVDQHRIPSGFRYGFTQVHGKEQQIVFCYIPPEGTQPGDVLAADPDTDPFDPVIVVQSPEGKVKGPAELVDMSLAQAGRIRRRFMEYYYSKHPEKRT